ncbi:hypothetical protein ASG40_16860 [Methylobacterium sp. Leaf399]|uniref:hypothetical protein n=1 Tax=unclassified Methylobacterium TaxID=2615210 RepID=UPI0006F6EB11|nr:MULTISPECIES: hypothetical protein [unclassified Methylobacterium]KQP59126.1 hypothetical protein ASF39_16835 [Methylobacterium sp. Leaf108]KQT18729.1 hypothetical protein ASG40_16860 [Methylobacterium sp. Leaf399]KQT88791.1 hypothetical protein ASG59_14460 [Methylobacterium sp. Leaf466]
MSSSYNTLVLYGFLLIVGGLLLALRARRAVDGPAKSKSLSLAGVIVVSGLGFWAASILMDT